MSSISILIGLAVGYLAATISESLMHKFFGHASYKFRHFLSKWGIVGEVVHDVHFGHTVVHHAKTFRGDHVTQFDSPVDKEKLDEYLLLEEKEAHIKVDYGLVTSYFGMAYFFLPPLCFVVVAYLAVSPWLTWHFLIAAILPTFVPPILSRYVHPYLHLPIKVAETRGGVVLNWILKSWYGEWAKKCHYVHHRHPRYNFNLLPGGDLLLGLYRAPSPEELSEMRKIELLPQKISLADEA